MEYDKEKAKIRFDALQDKSGFNWKKGYDPNDTIQKDGWYGAFNAEGVWEKVKVNEQLSGNNEQLTKRSTSEIKIIKDGDTAILYDPGTTLLNTENLVYLTEDGEAYGELESDKEKTIEAIRNELVSLGVKHISAIGVPKNDDEKILAQYKAVLKDVASSSLSMMDTKTVDAIIQKQNDTQQKNAEESVGLEMENLIRSVPIMGMANREHAVSRALTSGIVTVPLQAMNIKDAEALGLSEDEINIISKHHVSEENKTEYETALSNLYAGWSAYAGSGMTKIELAEMIQSYYENGKQLPDEIITAETSLASLLSEPIEKDENGIHVFIPNVPGSYGQEEFIDLYDDVARAKYLKKLEKAGILPKGGSATTTALLQELLPSNATGTTKEKINRSVTRGLKEYQAISMSTGMTIKEVIDTAIASTSTTASTTAASTLKKKVFYELPLENVIASASQENFQSRDISIEPLLYGMERREAPSVVIGGNAGTSLRDYGFDEETLETQYGYGKQNAKDISLFLENIMLQDDKSSDTIVTELGEIIRRKESPVMLKKSIISHLEARDSTSFNLKSNAGLSAYKVSNRFAQSGLSSQLLSELVAERKVNYSPTTNIVSLAPKYRDTGKVKSITRKLPRRIPEKISLNGIFPEASSKSLRNVLDAKNVVPIGISSVQSFSQSNKTFEGSSIPSNVASIPKANNSSSLANVQSLPDYNISVRHKTPSQHVDPETTRLRRIEEEYLKEKAEWEKNKQPALARSASHELGSAGETILDKEADRPEKVGKLLHDEFMKNAKRDLL
jgi:hypothetical protein